MACVASRLCAAYELCPGTASINSVGAFGRSCVSGYFAFVVTHTHHKESWDGTIIVVWPPAPAM